MTAANILRYLAHAALFTLIAAAIWLPARRIWLKRRGAQADLQKGQRNRPHPRPSDRREFCAQAPAGTECAHGQQESGASRANPRKSLPARLFPDGDPRQEALLLAMVAYLAALAEIIALRIGLGHAARTLNLIPLETTLAQLRGGAWPLLYHSLGNVGWFVPLGALLAARNPNLRFWAARRRRRLAQRARRARRLGDRLRRTGAAAAHAEDMSTMEDRPNGRLAEPRPFQRSSGRAANV